MMGWTDFVLVASRTWRWLLGRLGSWSEACWIAGFLNFRLSSAALEMRCLLYEDQFELYVLLGQKLCVSTVDEKVS